MSPAPRQHTPGPWDVEPKGSRHFVDGADGLTVAYLDRAGVRERAEIEANARLIAAAPELLAALESIAAIVPDVMSKQAEDGFRYHTAEDAYRVHLAGLINQARNQARAAIARATGGNAS